MALKPKARQILLAVALVVVAFLLARRYLPMMEIPTDGLIREETVRLESLAGDLAVQQKMNGDWYADVQRLRKKAAVFWVRKDAGVPVEQEVLDEFNDIARLASVNIQSREPRLVRIPNAANVQEVELRIEMRGISMKEFTRLLKEIARSKRKFYWASCKIDPDNVQKPTGIRVTGRLKAYVLTDEATRLLNMGDEPGKDAQPAEGAAAGGQARGSGRRGAANGANTARRIGK